MKEKITIKQRIIGLLGNIIIDTLVGRKKRAELFEQSIRPHKETVHRLGLIAQAIMIQQKEQPLTPNQHFLLSTASREDVEMATRLFIPATAITTNGFVNKKTPF